MCRDFIKTVERPLEREVAGEDGSRECASKLMTRQNLKAGSSSGHARMEWEMCLYCGRMSGRRSYLIRARTLKLGHSLYNFAQFSYNLRGD